MDSAKLNDWMQVVGIFAVVASLMFVGLQMRQDRVLATVEALSSRSDTLSDLAELIGNNNTVWVKGLNGDEMSEGDQATFQAIAEAVESYFVSLYIRLNSLGGSGASRSSDEAINNYAFALYMHKGLRQAWSRQLDYWRVRESTFDVADGGAEFRSLVDAGLDKLDEDAPPLPIEKRYVFW